MDSERLSQKKEVRVAIGEWKTASSGSLIYAAGFAKLPFAKYYFASIIPWSLISIIFFTATSAAKQQSASLFFIPGMVLLIASFSIFYFLKRKW